MKAKVLRLKLPTGRRIIAISDMHGNLPYLEGLIKKLELSDNDVLLILGDMVDKGGESLATLRYIMRLFRTYTVYALCGNCDAWYMFTDMPYDDIQMDAAVNEYLVGGSKGWGDGLLAQMCIEAGLEIRPGMDMPLVRRTLREKFVPELDFLRALPTIIETQNYTFVHGGLPEGELDELDAPSCMKNDEFMRQGRKFDKWCIVGHWPVVLYGGDVTNANPIIDRENRIISIDGGCVLKDDGQLNALIIPFDGSEDFETVYYDKFPVRRVKTAQKASERSCYVKYGDSVVRVLERGAEFSRCEHIRTGYRLDILTKYLYGAGEVCRCNDCTDYVLPLEAGSEVSVVETTSRGCLVKHNGISGWYFGQLE